MFDLAPNNRDQTDEVLLDDLRAVSSKLGGIKLTREQYLRHGRFAPATLANRFGGWGEALEQAGLEAPRHFSVSKNEALADIQRVARDIGAKTLTVALYRLHGKYSEKVFLRTFGSWVLALDAAGLRPSEQYHPRSRDEDLFDNLEVVWQGLGQQPTVNDMFAPRSRFSADTYKRRFGGWRKALEAFVSASTLPIADSKTVAEPVVLIEPNTNSQPNEEHSTAPKARSVGWRLRYIVLRRDRFTCRACGRSPANYPGLVLHIDHIVPWSKGGLTVEPNLQTLCEECNGGKGAN